MGVAFYMEKEQYSLTFPQKNIWLVEKYHKDIGVNTLIGIVNIKRDFNAKTCILALNDLLKYDENMRIRVDFDGEKATQYVADYEVEEIEIVDMSKYSDQEIEEYTQKLASHSLFLLNEKLFTLKVFEYQDGTGAVCFALHHIISDAWSGGLIVSKFVKYYELEKKGQPLSEEVIPSYLDYVVTEKEYAESEKYQKDQAFWEEYLAGTPKVASLKKVTKKRKNHAQRYRVVLEQDFNQKLLEFCKENRISPYTLFMCILGIYIYKTTYLEDFIIGTPVLNRGNFKEKNMIGMFVSTIPYRMKITGEEEVMSFCKETTRNIMTIFRHQKYPYSEMLEYVHKNTSLKSNLYQIVLSYQNARADYQGLEDYSATWHFNHLLNEELQIHIADLNNNGILEIYYDYLTDTFSEEEIKLIHLRLMKLLKNIMDKVDMKIKEVDLVPEEEKRLLQEFNVTSAPYPKEKTVVALLEEQKEKTPENIALIYGNEKMSYQELCQRIDQFASNLQDIKGENILVYAKNSFEVVIAIYGILKSGNTYIPVGIDTPLDRVSHIIEDSHCRYAVSDVELKDVILLNVNQKKNPNWVNRIEANPQDIAYMIYTSGSTGRPKGVKISHQSLTNYIWWAKKSYVTTELPVMPLYSSIGFDLTVTTLFMPLIAGGTILICSNNHEEIINIFRQDNVSIVKLTPAHLSIINEANIKIKNIHTLILGGEALKTSDAKMITRLGNRMKIFNEYGPTEATVGCMIYEYNAKDKTETVPIGKPADNVSIYILDKESKLCPLEVEGELCIEGDGLAQGYYHLDDMTQKVFVKNPVTGNRMYKTGDIAKMGMDLNVRYIGRKDQQIKIHGNRIELEEIENIVKDEFDVKNAVATVQNVLNTPNIYLYYVSDYEYSDEVFQNRLKEVLPSYMIPFKYIKIDKIPINRNGKVVRKELPLPEVVIKEDKEEVSYQNELEELLCKTWEELLNIKGIRPTDQILDYGVDSLNIIKCQVKLSNILGVIDIQAFYDYPVIRDFCNNIKKKSKKEEISVRELEKYQEVMPPQKIFLEAKEGIILTGATGFLGAHLLREFLLRKEIKKIYCIVRGMDYEKRLYKRFLEYFGHEYDSLYNEKVLPIKGNIEEENLGLSEQELEQILPNVFKIVNAAAMVKHNGIVREFQRINVVSVESLIKLCLKYDLVLDHISTISVSGQDGRKALTEERFYIGQDYQINPYIVSKFKAEYLILKAQDRKKLKANIYRVGNLTWRYADGKFQVNEKDNAFLMSIKNILDLGVYPSSFKKIELELTPVDVASHFIVSLMFHDLDIVNKVYHICHLDKVKLTTLINCLDVPLQEVDENTFSLKAKNFDTDENRILNEVYHFANMLKSKVDNRKTIEELESMGKKWPPISKEYLGYIFDVIHRGKK